MQEFDIEELGMIATAVQFYMDSAPKKRINESLMVHYGDILNDLKSMVASGNSVEEDFDPYTDPETKAMLERAGIATYKYRR